MNTTVKAGLVRVMRAVHRIGRALAWPLSSRWRMVATTWLFGLITVGNGGVARAGTGFIVSPDLGHVGGQTVFERWDVSSYSYPVDTDSSHSGLGTSQLWDLINAVTNLVTWAALSLLRGAIAAIQWMLHLTIYADQRSTIDTSMHSLATDVFLPLLATTMAIGGFTIYAKSRRDGGGMVGELAWFLAATIFSLTFVLQPSTVLDTVDGARATLSNAMMTTYTKSAGGTQSSTGIPAPAVGSDTNGAIRSLSDGLWNTYGVSEWCFVAWDSTDSCKVVAKQYLEDPQASSGPWGDAKTCMTNDGDCKPFGKDTAWVRGQDPGRLGAALLLAVVTAGAAICLLALFVFGLMAAVGVIILIFLGVLFMAAWMIPGRPRAIGVRWLEATIGTFLQSLIITTVIGAVMVISSIFNNAVSTYGIFMTAVLNLVALFLGLRYRSQFEHLMGFGTSATGTGVVSSYMAARMITGGARMGGRLIGRGASATARGAFADARMAGRLGMAGAQGAGAGIVHVGQAAYARQVSRRLAPLRPVTVPAGGRPPGGPGKPPGAAGSVPVTRRQPVPVIGEDFPGFGGTPPPPPAAPAPQTHRPAVPRPVASGRPAPGSPPPPAGGQPTGPRLATPSRPAPSGSTPPPPAPPAAAPPRMAAGRRYRVAPVRSEK